jgi:type II secretory pathway pseudopilin PulG
MKIKNSKLKTKNFQTGFTLIETIIYLAIVSMILVSTSYLIIDLVSGQTKSVAKQEVNHNLRFISTEIIQDIRSAQAIGSLSADTLVLSMPGDDITYIFDAGNLKLTRQLGAGSPIDLNTSQVNVTGSFTNYSYTTRSSNVGVSLTVEYKNPENLPDYEADSTTVFTVELRGRR